jgi:hypothetical protein
MIYLTHLSEFDFQIGHLFLSLVPVAIYFIQKIGRRFPGGENKGYEIELSSCYVLFSRGFLDFTQLFGHM